MVPPFHRAVSAKTALPKIFWGSKDPIESAHLPERSSERTCRLVALCHVWTAPGWQELSSRPQAGSVQPCVRPVCAVHMTAGHNALRGSGPGQKPAFENAVAHVGCPDRRIDRLCITC